jgi:hypothetical protein
MSVAEVIELKPKKPRKPRSDSGKPRKPKSPSTKSADAGTKQSGRKALGRSLASENATAGSRAARYVGYDEVKAAQWPPLARPLTSGAMSEPQPANPAPATNSVAQGEIGQLADFAFGARQTVEGELWLALVHGTNAAALIIKALWRWANSKLAELK